MSPPPLPFALVAPSRNVFVRLPAKNRPMHWLMREAIEQYVTREEQRESFRQDTLEAWRAYQKTGLHVSGDEVVSWLNSWGEENELPPPMPHT